MKLLRLAALTVLVSLAACTSSPTESTPNDPVEPSLGSGPGFLGSGNYAGDGDSQIVSSDTTTTPERGGNMLGSGN